MKNPTSPLSHTPLVRHDKPAFDPAAQFKPRTMWAVVEVEYGVVEHESGLLLTLRTWEIGTSPLDAARRWLRRHRGTKAVFRTLVEGRKASAISKEERSHADQRQDQPEAVEDPTIRQPARCACGRSVHHHGRCWWRRLQHRAVTETRPGTMIEQAAVASEGVGVQIA